MIVINMLEFKEEYKVLFLMGFFFGYVGFGEGGVFIEVVWWKLYSVVLFDEMEKVYFGV